MQFIQGDTKSAATMLAERLCKEAMKGRRVLWLICGGSNVATAVDTWNQVRAKCVKGELENISISLTDERFGPVGHKDSNWQQMLDAGFEFALAKEAVPVLLGGTLEETVDAYEKAFERLSERADIIIAQFGFGADGHIAGTLPGSPAVRSERLAAGYKEKAFTRLTLTPKALRDIDVAFAFVFGESKREVVRDLRDKDIPLEKQPLQILKELPEVYVVSDQL